MYIQRQLLISLTTVTIISTTSALLCYDSSYPSPHSTQECADGMVCYQEYYAVEREDRIDQYFDRFCVHERECRLRGFHDVCTTFDEMDREVQGTFEKFRLLNKGSNRSDLVTSKFCCCDTQLCNSFDVFKAEKEFGMHPIKTRSQGLNAADSTYHNRLVMLILLIFGTF